MCTWTLKSLDASNVKPKLSEWRVKQIILDESILDSVAITNYSII